MEWKSIEGDIEIEEYPDGTMGIIFSKRLRDKFSDVFKDKQLNIFLAVGKQDRKMIIEVTVAKEDYIA